ncbi:NAD(P)-binding protein [Cadophora sp. DSE1049]|nr:NAD(P)-binding protein [Cadophora sp. DSE1049]
MLILIAGISGSLGQRLATIALSRGISVRGLGRTPSALSPSLSTQLESFIKSTSYYDVPALDLAVSGVDAVINAYAPHPLLDLDGSLLLLRAAERANIKIFIASSWSRDWTNIKFGDFEHYDNHMAFQQQAAKTSSIKPVYIFSGLFADLLYSPYGPGGWDGSGDNPKMKYWGEGDRVGKWPWSSQDDAAAWTIDILMFGDGVQEGKGGFFKFSSGVTTIKELAETYERVHGVKVDVVRQGSVEDLEAQLARLRVEKGVAMNHLYMSEAAAVIGSNGLWENKDVVSLKQFRKPISLEDYFTQEKNKKA